VDDGAKGAGSKDVALHIVDGIGLDSLGAEFLDGPVDGLLIDVGDDELGAGFMQMLAQVVAHMADALNSHGLAGNVVAAPYFLGGGQHAHENTQSCLGGGVAAAAGRSRYTGDVLGFQADDVHVLDGGAHVFGGNVAAVEALDKA